MREVLCKARLKDVEQWIEGFYCSMKETTYCCAEDYKRCPVPLHHLIAVDTMTDWGLPNKLRLYEIDPETLCEYTGLSDKNNKKIFENDIVKHGDTISVVRYGKFTKGDSSSVYGWYFTNGDIKEYESYEIIGNRYDNPELLERNKKSE